MSNTRTQSGLARNTRSANRRTQFRWAHWRKLTGCLCVIAAIVLLAITAKITTKWSFQVPSEQIVRSAEAPRTGTIVLQSAGNQCESMKFDNDSGRTVESLKPCDNTVIRDAHGNPVPLGTLHRLDAISRSFLRQ